MRVLLHHKRLYNIEQNKKLFASIKFCSESTVVTGVGAVSPASTLDRVCQCALFVSMKKVANSVFYIFMRIQIYAFIVYMLLLCKNCF